MTATFTMPERMRDRIHAHPRAATVLALALLVGISVLLRTQALHAKFWIDEGLSVGIASHSLTDIPGVLRQDGSPPLYYLLLHVWIDVIGGDGEARTHALSLLFAVAMIPVAWLAGRALFDDARTAWACAGLATLNPFLTFYAQETRMYTLVALLGMAVVTLLALVFVRRRRGAIPGFAVACAALLYPHNWGLFLAAGCVIAVAMLVRVAAPPLRRELVRDALLAFGGVALLYSPWLPSLLYQAQHTGAPWSETPPLDAILSGLQSMLGGPGPAIMVALVAGAGLLGLRHLPDESERARVAVTILVAGLSGVALAWLSSQVSPAWANRYFAVFVGPALLLLGAGLVRSGKLGLVALAIVLALWIDTRERQLKGKGDAFRVAHVLKERQLIAPGDLVVNTHPEHGPVIRYYLGDGFQWANALGPVRDPQVFDWRDALDKLERTGPRRVMRRLLPDLSPGRRLILVQPIIRSGRWGAPWTELVRRRAGQWERTLDHMPELRRLQPVPRFERRPLPHGVRAVVYTRL